MNDKLDEPLDENEKRRLEMKSYIGCLVNVLRNSRIALSEI